MTKEELIKELNELEEDPANCEFGTIDCESTHKMADQLLLNYISDKDIEEAFDNLTKWYA